jgi:hypothetical protein
MFLAPAPALEMAREAPKIALAPRLLYRYKHTRQRQVLLSLFERNRQDTEKEIFCSRNRPVFFFIQDQKSIDTRVHPIER